MNVVIDKFRDWEFSPMTSRVGLDHNPQVLLNRYVPSYFLLFVVKLHIVTTVPSMIKLD